MDKRSILVCTRLALFVQQRSRKKVDILRREEIPLQEHIDSEHAIWCKAVCIAKPLSYRMDEEGFKSQPYYSISVLSTSGDRSTGSGERSCEQDDAIRKSKNRNVVIT